MNLIKLPIVFFKYNEEEKGDFNASYENVIKELGLDEEENDSTVREEILIESIVDVDLFKYPMFTPYLESDGTLSKKYTTIFYGDQGLRFQIKVKMGVDETVNKFLYSKPLQSGV